MDPKHLKLPNLNIYPKHLKRDLARNTYHTALDLVDVMNSLISTNILAKLTYLEGWKAVSLANEIFQFNGWSHSIVDQTVDYVLFTKIHYNIISWIVRMENTALEYQPLFESRLKMEASMK